MNIKQIEEVAKQAEAGQVEGEQAADADVPQQVDGEADSGQKALDLNTEELDRVASERSERAERAAIKSMLKQQGLSEEEAMQAFEAYKAQKDQQREAERNDLSALQSRVDQYEKQGNEMLNLANKRLIRAEAMLQASSLNVKPERVDYLIRLADLSGVEVDEAGQADGAGIREALETALRDIPELTRQTEETKPGFKVGAPGQQKTADVNDKLASIFGNK